MTYPYLPEELLAELPRSAHLALEPVTSEALAELLANLDERDALEARQILGIGADRAVMKSLRRAVWALVLREPQGRVLALGGIAPEGEGVVSPWMVTTRNLAASSLETRLAYLELARGMVGALQRRYVCLVNIVTLQNRAAVQLLGWLGADFDPPVDFGVDKVPACFFFFDQASEVNHVY
jgi:hypothetical protein